MYAIEIAKEISYKFYSRNCRLWIRILSRDIQYSFYSRNCREWTRTLSSNITSKASGVSKMDYFGFPPTVKCGMCISITGRSWVRVAFQRKALVVCLFVCLFVSGLPLDDTPVPYAFSRASTNFTAVKADETTG